MPIISLLHCLRENIYDLLAYFDHCNWLVQKWKIKTMLTLQCFPQPYCIVLVDTFVVVVAKPLLKRGWVYFIPSWSRWSEIHPSLLFVLLILQSSTLTLIEFSINSVLSYHPPAQKSSQIAKTPTITKAGLCSEIFHWSEVQCPHLKQFFFCKKNWFEVHEKFLYLKWSTFFKTYKL